MDIFLTILKYAAGPVLGALIGYFTNWLAVRMLFRPYYPKRIGKLVLPFTPGIIPKRKPALAKAVGEAVGGQLFTTEDMAAALASDSAKDKIADYAVALWKEAGEKTAEELLNRIVAEDKQTALKSAAEEFISDKVFCAVERADIGAVVAREGMKAVKEKKASLGMLSMFISDELLSSLAAKLSDGVNAYVGRNGRQFIKEAVRGELEKALNSPLSALTERADEQSVRLAACHIYEKAVKRAVAELAESVDISAAVEAKLNEMDVKELEKLVLSVMKRELKAIVDLGALIGFILGIIMIFV